MVLSRKSKNLRKKLVFFIILTFFILQITQIKYVSAWNTGMTSVSQKSIGNGFGYVQSQISVKGRNNSTHSLTVTFRITSNGNTDPISLLNVNVTVCRNGTDSIWINSTPSGFAYIKTISYPIYYANNITVNGTVQADFNVAGKPTNVTFPVQVSYVSPNPPEFTIGTPVSIGIIIISLITGIAVILKLIKPKISLNQKKM